MSAVPVRRGRALVELLRPDALRWVALGAVLAAGSGLQLAGPLIVRRVVDVADAGSTTATITRLAVLFLIVALATQAVAVVVAWFATTTAWQTTNQIRMRMARHVLGLDHEFHRRHTPGELISRVDGDVTSVSDFLGEVVPTMASAAFLATGMLGVLGVLDWRIALGGLVYVLVSLIVVLRGGDRAVVEASDEMGALARLYGGIEERLTAAEDIRANGAGGHALWRFIEDSSGAVRSGLRRERAFLRLWWSVQGAVAAGSVLSLIASAWLLTRGTISIGTAFLLFQYTLLLKRPLEDVVQQLETMQKASGAMQRVVNLLAVETTIRDAGTISPPAGALSVTLRGVSFEYDDERGVLHDIDLQLAAGRSLGIVGRTGSGKTTLSRLVLRLVEATSGSVQLGGVAIADIPMGELRHRVAMIPQEVELVSGSVRDNVTLYDRAPSDADVADALRRVGLTSLADDVHRRLGSAGVGLSAGEAQLMALARVWIRRPDLVVLDEATARIDPQTEALIESAVAEMMVDRTVIVIAHRLSTLHRMDEILVLHHGRVAEHDDRDRLAALGSSHFHRLLALALDDETAAT
jgi:ABC-type multidrug transport system fused ATPase/permease subunit